MRKYWPLVILILLLIPGYFVFEASHPKTAERYPFMIFLLAVDVYLWYSFRKKIFELRGLFKIPIIFLYWIPLAAFVLVTSVSSVKNVHLVNPALISYMMGVVLIIYFAKLVTVIFFFIADLYRIILYTLRHARVKRTGRPVSQETSLMSRGKFLRTVGLATGGVIFSGMLIGMVKWAHDFRVRRVDLRFPQLPLSFDGLRIVQISDLHLGSWATVQPVEEAVSIIRDLDPDLVLFTGDLVNYSTEEALRFKETLGGLTAKHGVYAILGNHDYGDYVNWPTPEAKKNNMDQMIDYFREINWKLLRNENVILGEDEDQLALIGVENWSSNPRFPKLGDIRQAMAGTGKAPVKILLSHDPSHWEHEISKDYPHIDLTLSGHTHGFQFGVELKRFKWSFAQYAYKYWAGLYQNENSVHSQYLYVNRGLGMIGYPGRVGILPEITLITLNA